MKFDCGPTWEEKYQEKCKLRNWHRWFAWHPVRVGSHDCRWLEYVERRNIDLVYDPTWEHRPLTEK